MKLRALALLVALATPALADTPPSVWDRAKDPSAAKAYDAHLVVQQYFAAADQARADAIRRARRAFDTVNLEKIYFEFEKPWYERVQRSLESVHAETSADVRLRFDYGLCLLKLKEYKKAASVLKEALAIAPWHPMATEGAHPAWLNYSFASAYLEDNEEERRGYEKFLERATESAERLVPMLNLAEAEMHLGNLTEAAHGYEAVLQTAASLPNEISMETSLLATWGLAVAQDRAGDFGAAARAADSAISMDPPSDSSRDPYFAASRLPPSYSVVPTGGITSIRKPIILDETTVFFVPKYERKWYLALGETALARRSADPNVQLFHWRAVEKFWTDYVTEAKSHKNVDRFVATAEKRRDAATKKREELDKRLGGKIKLPGPSRELFTE